MAVLIFFLAFSSILLYFFEKLKSKNVGIFTCLRLSFVYTLVLGAFISYFFCEIFSIFNVLDLVHLAIGWFLIFMVFAALVIKSGLKFEQSNTLILLPQFLPRQTLVVDLLPSLSPKHRCNMNCRSKKF